jgi:ABC-type taurine transport system ATPase subunit
MRVHRLGRYLLSLLLVATVAAPAMADAAKLGIGYQKGGALIILKADGTVEKRLALRGVAVARVEFAAGPVLLEALGAGSIDLAMTGEAPSVARPNPLLLDEPLDALDALTRLEMQELLEQVGREQGCTAVLVAHDVAEGASLADRVIVLEDGVVALEQTIAHARPRPRGNAELGAIEGAIIERLMRRGGRGAEQPAYATAR